MRNILKRSGVSDTDSISESLGKARIRLSALYTAVFGTLVLIVSSIFYYLFAADIHEDMSSVFPDESEQVRIINQHKGKLRNLMFLIDGGILIFIAGSGYILAGYSLRPVSESNESQKRFVADASHDLRTPLAILKADVEVNLADRNIPHSAKRIFRSYLEEIDQMKYIVENLLTLFRFDSNQVDLFREKIDLGQMITTDCRAMRAYASHRSIRMKVNKIQHIWLAGDIHMLRQACRNVLKNAIEYADPDTSVQVSVSVKNMNAIISVINEGNAIPPSDLPHIFDRFYRADSSRTRRREGSGLGLPVTKHIIEKHNGSITVRSSENTGTIVRITLPYNPSNRS